MKLRFFTLFSLAITMIAFTGCYQKDIDAINGRLDNLENSTIASINKQISSINSSLSSLEGVDSQLKGLISDLEKELGNTNRAIDDLKKKDSELEGKIGDLKKYVDSELSSAKDWVAATFATLEQYNSLVSDLENLRVLLKTSIEELEGKMNKKMAEDILSAITSSESSMKSWVNERLAGYYTIAEVDSKLQLLRSDLSEEDAELDQRITTLNEDLSKARSELTEAYKSVIRSAIETNNGVIDSKIASEVDSINKRIDTEVKDLSDRLNDIERRLGIIEGIAEELLKELSINILEYPSAIYPGSVAFLRYTLANAGKTSTVECIGENGWSGEVTQMSSSEGVIKITAPAGTADGKVIIFAVSAGKSTMKSLLFEHGILELEAVSYSVPWEGGAVEIPVCTNIDYVVEIPSEDQTWIDYVKTKAVRNETLVFNVSENPEDEPERSACIRIFDENANFIRAIEIRQSLQPSGDPILFVDSYVEQACVEKFDINGDGYLSYKEASMVKVIETDFLGKAKNVIRSFDELQLFDHLETIEREAFCCPSLSNIKLPESLKIIRESAFAGSSITSIIIPSSVTYIGSGAFSNNQHLSGSVTIPASVESLGSNVFASTGVESVDVQANITHLYMDVFGSCTALKEIRLSDSIESITNFAFEMCTSLEQIELPSSLKEVYGNPFYGCTNLRFMSGPFTSEDGRCLIVDGELKSCALAGLSDYSIPETVSVLGEYSCGFYSDINIVVPSTVKEIGYSAFIGNRNMSVDIRGDIASLEPWNFSYAGSKKVEYNKIVLPSTLRHISYYCFWECEIKELYLKSAIPPSGRPDRNCWIDTIYVPMENVQAYLDEGWVVIGIEY